MAEMQRRPRPGVSGFWKRPGNLGAALLLLSLLLPAGTSALAKPPLYLGEQLDYRIIYSGFLSVGKRIAVADATLRTPVKVHAGRAGSLFEADLWLTTEGHGFADSLYPIRYRVRTFYRLDPPGTALFSVFQKSKEKTQHHLYEVDSANGRLIRYRREENGGGAGSSPPPAQMMALLGEPGAFGKDRVGEFKAGISLLDRLSLLQYIRTLDLASGQQFRIPATDGSKEYSYSITVERQEKITIGERTWDAWKLRMEGVKLEGGGSKKEAHPPINIWISTDPNHTPVRAKIKHKFGQFTLDL